LSAKNSRTVYLKLQSEKINASALLTLRFVSYTLPNDAMDNEKFEVIFMKRISKTTFLEVLNSMDKDIME
jgi:hypothetical protein